jgi:hypothetical protein
MIPSEHHSLNLPPERCLLTSMLIVETRAGPVREGG